MDTIIQLLTGIGQQAWQSFWLPMLIWTSIATVFWLVLRSLHRVHPVINYRIRMALITSLPLGLLVYALFPFGQTLPAQFEFLILITGLNDSLMNTVTAETTRAAQWSWMAVAGALSLFTVLLVIAAIIRLVASSFALNTLKRELSLNHQPVHDAMIHELTSRLNIRRDVRIYADPACTVPFTFGFFHPIIVVPASYSQSESLGNIILHELMHIRRNDYLQQWFGNGIGALFIVNPLVCRIRKELCIFREMACDAEVLGSRFTTAKAYASLLMEFIRVPAAVPPAAAAMARHQSQINRRIAGFKMYMKHTNTMKRIKKQSLFGALITLLALTLAVACTDAVMQSEIQDPVSGMPAEETETFVVVEKMPEPIGGLAAIYNNVKYPEIARKAGIEGRVVLQFIVDTDGNVTDPKVIRGIGGGCDEAALDAIRGVRFTPGMQRGRPVNVQFQLPIVFKLQSSDHVTNTDKENSRLTQTGESTTSGSAELRGIVRDAATGEVLAGANIGIPALSRGSATDGTGNFMIRGLEDGSYDVVVTYVGYQPALGRVTVKDQRVTITTVTLVRETTSLSDVQVSSGTQ